MATAQQLETTGLWFWYGDGVNTASRPDTFDSIKADAVRHFKAKANATVS